jgi:Flp pilus assembly protein protease CpaA
MTLAAIVGILQPAQALICVLILVVWQMWEFSILGGADVKLLIAVVLVLGNPLVLIPISIFGGFQGVVAGLQKKREIPFVLSIFCGTFLFIVYPYFYCFLEKV